MNTTKLLLISSEFPPQPGGIGNHAFHLATALHKKGYEVTVQTNTRSAHGEEEAQFDNNLPFQVDRIPRYSLSFRTYLSRITKSKVNIAQNEIVLASGKYSLWMVGIWARFYTRKYIAIVHGSELRLSRKVLRQFTSYSLKQFDRLVAVSNFTKNMVPTAMRSTTVVIPNGFEMNAQPKPIHDISSPRLITVGNITRRKGQHQVVNGLAMALEKFPELKYTMVGIPTEQKSIESLAAVLGVSDSIRFMGKLSEEDKITQLQEATIFVMLSENSNEGAVEGFGIAILEANALGIPAIGALNCGIEDAIKDGQSGLLIDGTNAHALVNAIERITDNYQNFSKEAIRWSKGFGWDKIVQEYIAVIENE